MSLTAKSNLRRQFFKRSLVVAAGATALSTLDAIQPVAAAPLAGTQQPVQANPFLITIDGRPVKVAKVSGLGSRTTIVVAKDKSSAQPGELHWLPILLTTSDIQERVWIDWRNSVEQGKLLRYNLSIEACDATGKSIAQWQVFNAWPSVVAFKPADVGFVKLITLVHEGITRLK